MSLILTVAACFVAGVACLGIVAFASVILVIGALVLKVLEAIILGDI